MALSGHFEHAFNLDGSILRQRRYAHGGAGMPTLFAECLDHEVGCAVHHLGTLEKTRCGIDETTKPHHAHHVVEIADCDLYLSEQIDRASPRRLLAVFN